MIKITTYLDPDGERSVSWRDTERGATGQQQWPEGQTREELVREIEASVQDTIDDLKAEERRLEDAARRYSKMSPTEKMEVIQEANSYIARKIYTREEWDEAVIMAARNLHEGVSNMFKKMNT